VLSALIGALAGATAVLIGWRAWFFPEGLGPADASRDSGASAAAAIVDALPEPALLVEGGRVTAANGRARSLIGEWISGEDVRLVLRHPAAVERLAASAPAAQSDEIELTGLGEPGRHWTMAIAPVEGGGRLVRLTERSEAVAAEKMRVDFVANASHELRTPLATVLGFIETLQDEEAGGDPALRSRFLGLMDGEARRMQRLIEDLMSLSRIEAERFTAPTAPVDLLPLVEEVETGCATLLAARGNRIVTENEAGAAVVAGDQGQLLQLLRNLVVNAVKYGRAGEPIRVRFDDAGAMIRVSVADRGDGIAAEHLPRLTERFYRVDPGRSRAAGGTGLGLAIVKHIVGRHRGRLDIHSVPGEGTTVSVSLPRAAPPVMKR
jgi:two-component system phosphate regulon sensor histidine kinase PhoR